MGNEEDTSSDIAGCPAHSMEEGVLIPPPATAFYHDHLMGPFEVVVQHLGKRESPFLVTAAQQVVDKLAANS
jgi:hypothetical protein